jgi:hypothetical protein
MKPQPLRGLLVRQLLFQHQLYRFRLELCCLALVLLKNAGQRLMLSTASFSGLAPRKSV